MSKGKISGNIVLTSLILINIIVIGFGIYKDKKLIETNKNEAKAVELQDKEYIQKNTQYYLKTTLDKLENNQNTVIMFIGDSVTAGSNAKNPDENGYVGLFSKWIAEKYPESTVIRTRGIVPTLFVPIKNWNETVVQTGIKNTITIVNAGSSGDSMYQLYNRTNNFIKHNGKTPDCIFLMDGINDNQGAGKNRYSSPSRFKELQESFIDYLKDETGGDIVVMTSHWYGNTPASQISDYVSVQREIAKEKNLLLIDNNDMWIKHYNSNAPNYGQGDWMTSDDSIHPTDEGHKAIFQNIVDNLYNTTLKNNNVIDLVKMGDNRIDFEGSWNKVNITDDNAEASYEYMQGNNKDSKIHAKLTGNEIYAIIRDGKDVVTFDTKSEQYSANKGIKIGGSEYPSEFVTVQNQDMYSAQHKRVLLYEGKNQECDITLENINGNLDLYGFETVTYNK